MITKDFLKLLKANDNLKEFIEDREDFGILFKSLTKSEITRLMFEYPKLFNIDLDDFASKNPTNKSKKTHQSVISLTIIKKDLSKENLSRSKKVRLYIDVRNGKMIKILRN